MSLKETISELLDEATSPTAYSIYAGIGVVVTAALAIHATKKLCDNYYEKVLDKEPYATDPPKPSTKEVVKTFAPMVISGVVTLYFMYKSNDAWMEYNGFINSAYTMAEYRAQSYQGLASMAVGTELVRGLGKRKPEEGLDWYCISAVGEIPDIYFQATENDIYYAMYHTNRNFQLRGTSSVGEFFAFLPIAEDDLVAACPNWNDIKDYFGWDSMDFLDSGMTPWIDFNLWHVDPTENSPWIGKISYTWPPEFNEEHELLAYGYYPYPTE